MQRRSSGKYQELKSKPLEWIIIRQTSIFVFNFLRETSKILLQILFPFQIVFKKQPNLNLIEDLH